MYLVRGTLCGVPCAGGPCAGGRGPNPSKLTTTINASGHIGPYRALLGPYLGPYIGPYLGPYFGP